MSKNLVIVESPAKASTIQKYLGKDFTVLASYGHVRDLPPKTGAIIPERDFIIPNFEPNYLVLEKNAKHMDAIAKEMKKADQLFLATDPDREGEAISWHVMKVLEQGKLLKKKPVHRVVFYEITKNAVNEAIANPREISMDLVNAQQARRALDYLVGFNLSPLLWRKIRPGLSAGRVQSPALRLIVEREEEIEKFIAQEYWTILADVKKEKQKFSAKLTQYAGTKVEQFSFTNETDALTVKNTVLKDAKKQLKVVNVEKKQRKRNPAAPFITSTLQQEASRKLGFTAQRTMKTAQQLYEGIDIGEGRAGLITYMRTDSVNLAKEAIIEIRDVIEAQYGKHCVPKEPRIFKSKVKNAQEAHEAIRPTATATLPASVKKHLTPDQFKLYDLIWKRTIASQMAHAVMNTVAIDLSATDAHTFRANGSTIAEPGFLLVYQEGVDDGHANEGDDDEKILPELNVGDVVKLEDILAEQHFTEPPPRYGEASLIKSLEEYGIGRPSTYASIISTIQARAYVTLEQKRFTPTDIGRIVNKFLTAYFTRYVDYDFTAKLEDELDEISRGEKAWVPMMSAFWTGFKATIDDTAENVQRKDVTHEALDENCPKCGKQLSIRLGKRGRFVGCSGFPECDFTRSLTAGADEEPAQPEIVEGRVCPDCGSPLQIRQGRYGKFIGCTSYPKCKHIESLEKPGDTGITCPECKSGHLSKRKSRFGTYFYSCSAYPDCKYAISHEPIDMPCPKCAWPIMMLKTTKRKGTERVCTRKICGYAEPAPESAPE